MLGPSATKVTVVAIHVDSTCTCNMFVVSFLSRGSGWRVESRVHSLTNLRPQALRLPSCCLSILPMRHASGAQSVKQVGKSKTAILCGVNLSFSRPALETVDCDSCAQCDRCNWCTYRAMGMPLAHIQQRFRSKVAHFRIAVADESEQAWHGARLRTGIITEE